MEFINCLNQLIQKIEESPKIPMTGRKIIDEEVLELLDRIKVILPEEIVQAQQLLEQREQILAEARYEGERLIKEKENYITKMSNDNEITRRAQQLADQTVENAKKIAEETIEGANAYAEEVLGKMEESLLLTLQTIRKGRQKLQTLSKKASLG